MDAENFKKIAKGETAHKEPVERELIPLTEQVEQLRLSSEFTLQELKQATQNFDDSSKIGKGAYGCMAILSTIRHPNLVTLMGACSECSALVCEFLPNGSLEDLLNHGGNTTPLTWRVHTCIVAEICSASMFLHSSKPNIVIHGDLKPDNVLLDANFVSKLCHFGISRLTLSSDNNKTALHSTENIIGTPGYINPEFLQTFQLTEKFDIYSFVVIILRLVTGKPATGIASKVEEAIKELTCDEMVDASAGKWPLDQAKELAMLGLKCSEMRRKDRPNLNEIWSIVERHRRSF
ncbi:hypothetical protein LUZ60_007119 [Juncus effusus]|nr:hypothetical protein LUZ60_007119 [Juncus effusus]